MKRHPFLLARIFSLFRNKRPVIDYEQIFKGPSRPLTPPPLEVREAHAAGDPHGEICFREVFIHPVF